MLRLSLLPSFNLAQDPSPWRLYHHIQVGLVPLKMNPILFLQICSKFAMISSRVDSWGHYQGQDRELFPHKAFAVTSTFLSTPLPTPTTLFSIPLTVSFQGCEWGYKICSPFKTGFQNHCHSLEFN